MTLRIYVADDCWACRATRQIAAEAALRFPNVRVELQEIGDDRPDDVFAVPTYVLNGQIIFLGNPTSEELGQKLASAQQRVNI